jgi:ABC-type amino acid transport substrate-binding protein
MHTSSIHRSERSVAFALVFCGVTALAVAPTYAASASATFVTSDAQASADIAQPTTTLDRIRRAGRIVIGYRADAAPMSHRDPSGKPAEYSIALCITVADALKQALSQPSLAVEWVPVANGFAGFEAHRVDLICRADEITLENRAQASFSIPIFPGGVSALVRADADQALVAALEERPKPYAPLWRGTPPPTLEHRTYSALVGSDTAEALKETIAKLRLTANVEPVADYDAGIAAVLAQRSDVLFGDREKLLEVLQRTRAEKELRVLTRRFTFASLALATPRNDDDFRLAVDRALSEFYANPAFGALYTANFGTPDSDTVAFFRNVGVPARTPIRAPQ